MDSIYLAQTALADRIARVWTNFKKLKQDKMTRSACVVRMESLKKLWIQYEENHDKLLELEIDIQSKVKYFKDSIFEKTEEKYLDGLGKFQEFLDSMASSSLPDGQDCSSASRSAPVRESDRLPRIDIPKFSGDYDAWENFRDLFTSLVISRPNISMVSKMLYLRGNVEGDAQRLISSFPVTGGCFTEAWNKLKQRYENLDRLVQAHVSALFSVKYMKDGSASELKRVLSEFIPHLTSLKQLDRPVESWDDLLVHIMIKRLDEETVKQWIMFLSTTTDQTVPPTWNSLVSFLEGYTVTLETLEKRNIKKATVAPRPSKTGSGAFQVARSHVATGANDKCLICSKSHFFLFCEEYKAKTPRERSEFVASKKKCFRCLGNHFANKCNSDKNCRFCGGKHHSSLHRQVGGSSSAKNPGDQNANSKQEVEPQAANNVALNSVHSPKSVLLATAMIRVCNENNQEIFVRALIDPGAQISFVSESLCRKLQPKRKPISLAITGIGSERVHNCKSLVSLVIRPRFKSDFSYTLEACILPKITSYATPSSGISMNFENLKGLILADPDLCSAHPIDVLLGAEVYGHILEEGLMKGQKGPIAVKTALGWVVSGEVSPVPVASSLSVCLSSVGLDESLQRFWEQEEIKMNEPVLSKEDQYCEEFF